MPDDPLPSEDMYRTIAKLIVELGDITDASTAYARIADRLKELTDSDLAVAMVFERGRPHMRIAGISGMEMSELEGLPQIMCDPSTREMLAKGPRSTATIIEGLSEVPSGARSFCSALDLGVVMPASIILRDEPIGYLVAARRKGGESFSEAQKAVITFLSDCIAYVMDHIRTSYRLAQTQEETEKMLSVAPIGLMTVDAKGMIQSANPLMLTFLGKAEDAELAGMSVFEIPCVMKSGLDSLLMQALEGRAGEKGDVHMVPGEDKAFYLHTKASPLLGPDESTEAAILVAMDITSNVRLQSQLERSYEKLIQTYQELERVTKMKSQFIDVVSHELRTPLTVMRGYLDLLESEYAPSFEEKYVQKLRTIRANADKLYALVESMLDVSRLEKGTLEINPEPTKIDTLLEEVVSSRGHEAAEKRQSLSLEMEGELPLIMADRRRMRDVFNNIVDNALKYTQDEGRIKVGARDEGRIIHVWVKDNGVGIPLENLGKIFDRFYIVASNDLSHQVNRIGLSLPISKGIVEAHGGRLWVESQVGRGSVFHVSLPKEPAE